MRRVVFASALLFIALAVVVLRWRGSEEEAIEPPLDAPRVVLVEVREEPPPPKPEPIALEKPAEAERTELLSEPASGEEELVPELVEEQPPICELIGRFEDEHGHPLSGITLLLRSGKPWSENVEVPVADENPKLHGFDALTDTSGSFRFAVPSPTNSRTYLKVRPDLYHASKFIRFDSKRSDKQASLREGLRDLGTIRLDSTGAVRGRVTAEDGTLLAGVRVNVGRSSIRSSQDFDGGSRRQRDGFR